MPWCLALQGQWAHFLSEQDSLSSQCFGSKLPLWLWTPCHFLMTMLFKEHYYLSKGKTWQRHPAWTHQKCMNATLLWKRSHKRLARKRGSEHSCSLHRRGFSKAEWGRLKRSSGVMVPPIKREHFSSLQCRIIQIWGKRLWVIACPTYVPNNHELWNKVNLHTSILRLWYGHGDKAEKAGEKGPTYSTNFGIKS